MKKSHNFASGSFSKINLSKHSSKKNAAVMAGNEDLSRVNASRQYALVIMGWEFLWTSEKSTRFKMSKCPACLDVGCSTPLA